MAENEVRNLVRIVVFACIHIRALAAIGCTDGTVQQRVKQRVTTYLEDNMMKWDMGKLARYEWGKCEHVHIPRARRRALALSGQARDQRS